MHGTCQIIDLNTVQGRKMSFYAVALAALLVQLGSDPVGAYVEVSNDVSSVHF